MNAQKEVVPSPGPVTIAGERYVPVLETDLEHDGYLMGHVRAAGLADMARYQALPDDESRGFALLTDVFESGRTFDLLAGVLAREGTTWSREQAAENKLRFAQVKDEAGKATLRAALVELLFGFFVSARSSLPTSLKPSGRPGTRQAKSVPTAAGETMASGAKSSGRSRSSTRAARKKSPDGTSATRF